MQATLTIAPRHTPAVASLHAIIQVLLPADGGAQCPSYPLRMGFHASCARSADALMCIDGEADVLGLQVIIRVHARSMTVEQTCRGTGVLVYRGRSCSIL